MRARTRSRRRSSPPRRSGPTRACPDNPRGWLITVASRRLTDQLRGRPRPPAPRGDGGRAAAARGLRAPAPDDRRPTTDDTLTLLFLCCHPSLSPASQLALTLRAVGGLTTAEIARAFLVPEATMAQRISRAKATIRAAGAPFALPPADERAERLRGRAPRALPRSSTRATRRHPAPTCSAPSSPPRRSASRATSTGLLPDDGEVAGLLALMLLTDARRPARAAPDGNLVPLAEQDRSRWDRAEIAEGVALISDALASRAARAVPAPGGDRRRPRRGADAPRTTDWPQILALYELLDRIAPNPMVTLNQAVAVAMVDGPAGRARPARDARPTTSGSPSSHRLEAVRAHLLEMAGDAAAARTSYLAAARRRRASRSGATSRRARPASRRPALARLRGWSAPSPIPSCEWRAPTTRRQSTRS